MKEVNKMDNNGVSKRYLQYRKQVLEYTNVDMNLQLDSDEQVYIAVFVNIPVR